MRGECPAGVRKRVHRQNNIFHRLDASLTREKPVGTGQAELLVDHRQERKIGKP